MHLENVWADNLTADTIPVCFSIAAESEAAEDWSQLSCSLLFGRAQRGCFEFCHRSSGWLWAEMLHSHGHTTPALLGHGKSCTPAEPRWTCKWGGFLTDSPQQPLIPHMSPSSCQLLPSVVPLLCPALLTCFSSVSQLYPGQQCPHHRAKAVLWRQWVSGC